MYTFKISVCMCLDKKMMKNESLLQSENGVVLSLTRQHLHSKKPVADSISGPGAFLCTVLDVSFSHSPEVCT